MHRMQHQGGGPNTEPLLNPPPDRPPPVLRAIATTTANNTATQSNNEEIEMATFSEQPQPYERAEQRPMPPRYSREPKLPHKDQQLQAVLEEAQEGYYSRLKFPKQGKDQRSFSTSTHTYTEKEDGWSSSSAYISPSNLEPFFPTHEVTEKELMLQDETEKGAEFYASSQFLSDEEESLSEEGSLAEDGENVVVSSSVDVERISAWLNQNDKSPATGQTQDNCSGQEVEGEERKYVNVVHRPGTSAASKPRNKGKRQRSGKLRGNEVYMDLVKETGDYTSLYTSTMPRSSPPPTNT